MCNIKIHETQPLLNLKLDRVMQDIVYKLVPGLQDSEWPPCVWGGLLTPVLGGSWTRTNGFVGNHLDKEVNSQDKEN